MEILYKKKKNIPEAKVLQGINRQIAYIAQSHLPLNFSNERHQQPPAHLSKLVRNGMNKRQKDLLSSRYSVILERHAGCFSIPELKRFLF
jgi:hypothetical protein